LTRSAPMAQWCDAHAGNIVLDCAQALVRVQVKVLGYFIWSIYDNWEWAAGMG